MSNPKAYINPELIKWARERAGLNYAQIETSLAVSKDQIAAWEQGHELPTFNQAIALSNTFRIPFGYLFLPHSPEVSPPLPDLRTLPNEELREPSVDFLELLYQVLDKQEWYREYALEQGAVKLPFVSKFNMLDATPERVAADIRSTLNITSDLARTAGSWDNYLTLLSARADSSGILVMRSGVVGNNTKRTLDVKEFQGFAISDDIAPLVFINSEDFKTAQIFTFAHELAHIWIGKSGISTPDEAEIATPEHKVEVFCNTVAAEILVPRTEFLNEWRGDLREPLLESLARRFRVSTLVILRRAYELNRITRGEFYSILKQERFKQKARKPSGGGDYYRNVAARHGSKLVDAILRDVRQGGTVYRDAARLLSMKVPTLMKFMESSG